MTVSGAAVGAGTAGVILLWSAVTGKGILKTVQGIVAGQGAGKIPAYLPGSGAAGYAGSISGATVAADAMQYNGAGYVWGGAPAAGTGNWDCSSFCNWVIGHDLGLAIPGYRAGTYTGETHGPVTGEWLAWPGCVTVGHSGAAAEAGDLCVWQTHMGIAIGGGQMISAQTTQSGTQVSGIDGFIPEILFVRRLKSGPAAGTSQAPGTSTAGGRG